MKGADAYFINTNSGVTGVNIAKQAKELGLSPLFGSRAFEAARVADYPEILDGIIFYGTAGVVDMSTPQAQKLFTEYEKRTGKSPFCSFCVASRYDSTKVIASALETCGEDTLCIKDWLNELASYEGVIGTFNFDENGDPVGVPYAMSIFRDGKVDTP